MIMPEDSHEVLVPELLAKRVVGSIAEPVFLGQYNAKPNHDGTYLTLSSGVVSLSKTIPFAATIGSVSSW